MLAQILFAALLTAVTMMIHGGCTAVLLKFLSKAHARHWSVRTAHGRWMSVAGLGVALLSVTLIESILWSLTYVSLGVIESVEKAIYFSIVTFTTLGYGDVVPGEGWRILAALQAAVGILVFGWSTSLMITLVQRMSEEVRSRKKS